MGRNPNAAPRSNAGQHPNHRHVVLRRPLLWFLVGFFFVFNGLLFGCKGGSGDAGQSKRGPKVRRFPLLTDCPDPGIPFDREVQQKKGQVFNTIHGQKLALDISWPKAGKGPFPLVVLLHPGGWYRGDRSEMTTERAMLTGQGFAAASVDYRLSVGGKNPFPAAIQDVRCALRYLRKKSKEFSIDKGRVAIAGTSAGAHLAALAAVAGEDKRLDGPCPHKERPVEIQAAVAFYAPLDLRTFMGDSVPEEIINNFLGVSPHEDPQKAALASPITHLDAKDPPFFLSHGAKDVMVPVGQSRNFKWLLDKVGVPSLYIEVKEASHGYFMFKGQEIYRKSTCSSLAFLRSTLHLPPMKPPPKPEDEGEEPDPNNKPEPEVKAEDRPESKATPEPKPEPKAKPKSAG